MSVKNVVACVLLLLLLMGCSRPELPQLPDVSVELPDLSNLPGIPESLSQLPGLLEDLGLPDLSQVANLPDLADLPSLQAPPGGIIFSGPTERRINVGERIPGTEMVLTAITDNGAEFQIGGLRSVRKIGDSLDHDGAWPGLAGASYNLRLRIYIVADSYVRAAGIQRLVVPNIQPVMDNATPGGVTLKFPFTVGAQTGERFDGTTLSYGGSSDNGGQLGGLAEGEYPYRKIGDSVVWNGHLRGDLVAAYNLRLLYYDANQARVGGIVTLAVPGQ